MNMESLNVKMNYISNDLFPFTKWKKRKEKFQYLLRTYSHFVWRIIFKSQFFLIFKREPKKNFSVRNDDKMKQYSHKKAHINDSPIFHLLYQAHNKTKFFFFFWLLPIIIKSTLLHFHLYIIIFVFFSCILFTGSVIRWISNEHDFLFACCVCFCLTFFSSSVYSIRQCSFWWICSFHIIYLLLSWMVYKIHNKRQINIKKEKEKKTRNSKEVFGRKLTYMCTKTMRNAIKNYGSFR